MLQAATNEVSRCHPNPRTHALEQRAVDVRKKKKKNGFCSTSTMHFFPDTSRELPGVLLFRLKGQLFPYNLNWKVPCFPFFNCNLDLFGVRRLHSQEIVRQKDSSSRKMSTWAVKTMDMDVTTEEDSVALRLSPAYETAMEALSSLITRQKRGGASKIGGKYKKLDRMLMYIKILGLEGHLGGLKIIHVAGTKGKGSTCAFCEAILRECGFRTGLFTSPHLIDVRERFRVNGLDITEDKFLLHFWDCWHRLKLDLQENLTEDLPMPPLFQFLTVMAFKIFVEEKVDVAIIEVGLGGKKDSTNVIKEPVVCGIASLGMDHMEALGDTLAEIASHKAGIFKPQVPSFTVPQRSEAMDVLRERANELMIPLEVVAPIDCKWLDGIKLSLSGDHQYSNAALAASLCKSWIRSTGNWEKLFQHDDKDSLPEPFIRGLSTARLFGRAQIVHDSSSNSSTVSMVNGAASGDLTFYLDGAHSPESLEACGRWFATVVKDDKNLLSLDSCLKTGIGEEVSENGFVYTGSKESNKISKRILLFNCMDVRDPQILLPQLVNTCATLGTHFSKAIFVPSISTYNKVTSGASAVPFHLPAKDLTWQFNLQRIWENILHGKGFPEKPLKKENPACFPPNNFLYEDISHCKPADGSFACSTVVSSLPQTIKWLRDCVKENPRLRIQVLVTGSIHLVGDVLKLINR
ncbi:folylpolyglutamate synthase isoform X3 [Coffea arabica]|uniref:Folylpolyglutamate synthase n=1 Tax=Coffea arabica TaxID=13443 RepID=A0A6P6SQ70_COFAR|nr:folylpolyglutamate synthase isoform X3 [Coffea arabica]